ncbi:MAG: hypothetical protein V7L05_03685 [Nostoc sp.]|uniref:hypothetical protein n=1 Tax=Nostoc sp. TaxID=1180 RepID=UPI002FF9BBAE
MIIKSSQAIVLSQVRAIAQTHFFGKRSEAIPVLIRLLRSVPFSTRGCTNGNAKGERND